MATLNVINKAVLDVEESITELKRCFASEKIPVNDDNVALHRLEEKLETILQLGLKDKPGVFGVKKSYWDYICTCFSSSKRVHEGVLFIKSKSELKSSIGRGRALLRFCLMHKCLADTLQSCFMNAKISRDFYSEQCLPMQQKLWSSLITSLYDLNEINFSLNSLDSELDISWPSFARKVFASGEHLSSKIRCVEHGDIEASSDKDDMSQEARRLVKVNSELEADVLYLQKKCESLEKEISNAVKEENSHGMPKRVLQELSNFQTEENAHPITSNCFINDSDFINSSEDPRNYVCKKIHSNLKSDCSCNLNSLISSEILTARNTENHLNSSSENFPSVKNSYNNLMKVFPTPLQISFQPSNDTDGKIGVSQTIEDNTRYNMLRDISCFELFSPDKIKSIMQDDKLSFTDEANDYCNALILEMQFVMDCLYTQLLSHTADPLILSHLSNLKTLRDNLEQVLIVVFKQLEKSKQTHLSRENFLDSLKSFAIKQDLFSNSLMEKMNSIVNGNQSLFDNLGLLKEKLLSYGLLKTQPDNIVQQVKLEANVELPIMQNLNSDEFLHNDTELINCLPSNFIECYEIFKNSSSRLYSMSKQASTVQSLVDSSLNLNTDTLHRIQNHEIHMKGITKELEEAHSLLSAMRQQHQKLQTAENIVKYDLQEKRKLLTRLKEQLESTREDCKQVRIKNSKSEVEWKNLRKEFVLRNKQTSEESGFVDDKSVEDQTSGLDKTSSENVFSNDTVSKLVEKDAETNQEVKKSRLQLLEEQCQLLCNNLIQSSQKRKELDCRLEEWCKAIERSNAETSKQNEKLEIERAEKENRDGVSEKISIDSSNRGDGSVSSSAIGSLNSDSSLVLPTDLIISQRVGTSVDSLKSKPFSILEFKNLENSESRSVPIDISFCSSRSNFNSDLSNASDHISDDSSLKSVESVQDESRCDSVDFLEEYMEHETLSSSSQDLHRLESHESCCISEEKRLEDEKKILFSKYEELEKENALISKKLNDTLQQLKLTEDSKEHEIAALQFQLNSEVLNYERSLQEFSKNNEGIKDMREKVNDQEQLILALEEALSEIQMERENEKENQWEQLQDIQLALEAREEECFKLSSGIEKLEEFRKNSLRDRETMELEILRLQSDSRALRRKIIKLLKEKDILWKMNDRLKFLQKVQIDDRWMDDREVSECTECKSHFSFILRKHHCRHCGRIFCNSCSNNWLLTPSSRNQIRVCNECYAQYMEIKDNVRRDSLVEHSNESDDDNDDDLFAKLNRRTSCSSDNHPNITDSIVSLPTMQTSSLKQKSLFTSAPQLNIEHEAQNVHPSRLADYTVLSTQIDDIEYDISSTFVVKAGEETVLPIVNGRNTTLIHWSFDLPCEAIPISLLYEDTTNNCFQQTVLHQSTCETEGVVQLPLPGLYKFHFDNRSRYSSVSVRYTFKTQHLIEDDLQS